MEKLEKLKILSEGEIEKIHENSLEILEKTGVYIYSEEALKTFAGLGLQVELQSQIVKFPRNVVTECLKKIPKEIALYNRRGEASALLGRGYSYAASGHNAIYVLDGKNNRRRSATKEDVGIFALLSDYLPDIDVVGIEAMPQDVKAESSLVHAIDEAFQNTEKHVFFSPERKEVADPIFQIADVVIDSGSIQKKPPLTCQLSPTSPLTWEKGAVEALMATVERSVPLCLLPQPFAGVTSPYTLAGLLTVHNAETLSGVVFSQLLSPGTPVVYGSGWSTFDMRTANVILGSPETVLLRIAGSQLAEFYRIPYHTIAPDTDAHVMDEQLAWEKCATSWGAFLAHSDLIVNGGMFSTGLTVSLEQLVLDHEIISYVKRMTRGIRVEEDTLALDIIEGVGPRGNYLGEEHTLKFLGTGEHWEPVISNREIYENWRRKGEKDVIQRAKEKVNSILKVHSVPELSNQKKREIEKIIKYFENTV
jgi:trimethylamine--corrinoid protein Co-methyltransferase